MPASAIRFTQCDIDSRAIFQHGEAGETKALDYSPSIYQTLDGLWRGHVKPEDLPPLESCYAMVNFGA